MSRRGELSPESWQWALDSLARRPFEVAVHLDEVDEDGGPVPDSDAGALRVSVGRAADAAGWVWFRVMGSVPGPEGDLRRPAVPAGWASLVRDVAARAGEAFAVVSDDAYNGEVGLQQCLPVAARKGTGASRDLLRGYSWVTICPQPISDRLGGVRALAGTGAFWAVAELPSGDTWLQATEHFGDYDDAAVIRVFDALAPVLPAGLPSPGLVEKLRYHLAWRDPAWYRAGGGARPVPRLAPDVVAALPGAVPRAGTVTSVPGGYVLAFERQVPQDVASAWPALSTPALVDRWLGWHPGGRPGQSGRIDLAPGGVIVQPYCAPMDRGPRIACNVSAGTVTAAQVPERLEYVIPGIDGPKAATRWLLRPDDGGTAISLRYEIQVRDRLPWALADWHCRLDAIAALLGGRDPASAWTTYEDHVAAYQRAAT